MRFTIHPVRSASRPTRGLWVMVLFCVSVLFGASTAQACHVHDAGHVGDGKVWVSAPADECPLCAATHPALPAEQQTTAALIPQVGAVVLLCAENAHVERWSYEMFSRPPPQGISSAA